MPVISGLDEVPLSSYTRVTFLVQGKTRVHGVEAVRATAGDSGNNLYSCW